MDKAKLLLNLDSPRSHEGYFGKEDQVRVEYADSQADSDDDSVLVKDDYCYKSEDLLINYQPSPGSPFSAITPSMWPPEILTSLQQDPESNCKIDEFGFWLDSCQDEWLKTNKLTMEPFVEDSQLRLHWLAQLEFGEGNELSWDNVAVKLCKTDKMRSMVRKGIPHSLRPQLWMRFSGALHKKRKSVINYREIVTRSSEDKLKLSSEAEKDISRTLSANACFSSLTSTGIARLRRINCAIEWFFMDSVYCQGIGLLVAFLLLFLEEDDTFWLTVTIVEELLPASYFIHGFQGVEADSQALRSLLATVYPDIDEGLDRNGVDTNILGVNWLIPLYARVLHIKIVLRIWDVFFLDGFPVLFQVALAIFQTLKDVIIRSNNSSIVNNALFNKTGEIDDIEKFMQTTFECASLVTDELLDEIRRKHQVYMLTQQRSCIDKDDSSGNLLNHRTRLTRRELPKGKSMMQQLILFNDNLEEDLKYKNVKQTELLVRLKESVSRIANHFVSTDEKLKNVSIVPDYSVESHAKDHLEYTSVSASRRRRAKALVDFEKHDDDELGFKRCDVITIISQKDDHCWIGELNGSTGWFPAKFVELLDERTKQYSSAGDDGVNGKIAELVRGVLCPTIKNILQHGMRRPSFLGGYCHPWSFIEEAAVWQVEKNFDCVYSRLILCKTFRLDEDGKVLTPEELLYRSVQTVNQTHDAAHAQMDVKLRTLVCIGLNEQVLHLWLEILCSCVEVVRKWYDPWSFVCSPGWVQIKCEIRVLSQFPFNLNPDWELPYRKEKSQPLKDGVRDMLVKHHLFSWDL